MARKISIRQAINEAIDQEMQRDPTVIVMGEDIVGGTGAPGEADAWGGVLGVTKGLYAKHGNRLMDTPLSESAYIGAAIGAATCGLRPVAELMFIDFMGVCLDQIFNQAAKFRYMFGGKAETPVVLRHAARLRAAAQHGQMLTSTFTHIPGLKVVCPSNAYDAKGLLIQSIRDNDPVIFLEHKNLYGHESEVPEESYAIPFAEANIVREGKHATIVTYGQTVHRSVEAATVLAREGVECDVIDPDPVSVDMDTVFERGTPGASICVDEANPRCSVAADVWRWWRRRSSMP
jgi:pyruvate dehydrogenase E1 component beta subunit